MGASSGSGGGSGTGSVGGSGVAPGRTLVVGAALVRDGRVLAARRTSPPAAAGRWELPGGKVEPGEDPDEALVREVAEELGVTVRVVAWLDGESPIGDALILRVARVELVAGEPVATEHDALRWLGPEDLSSVDWLASDRPFLPQLAALLARLGGARGIFFDEDDARAVVRRLRGEGYETELARERLAGEDDDEDHPWAVVTEAPDIVLELLVDEYDGWLDQPEPTTTGPVLPPLDLPVAPRRIKRAGPH